MCLFSNDLVWTRIVYNGTRFFIISHLFVLVFVVVVVFFWVDVVFLFLISSFPFCLFLSCFWVRPVLFGSVRFGFYLILWKRFVDSIRC